MQPYSPTLSPQGSLKILRVMGLRESLYWLSWWTTFLILFFFVALVYSLVGYLFTNIQIFQECSLLVHILIAWSFLAAYSSLCLLLAAVIRTQRNLLTSQIFLIVVPLLLHFFILDADKPWAFWDHRTVPQDFFTRLYHPANNVIGKFLFNIQPSFHFAKMILDVYAITGTGGGRRSFRQSHERFTQLSLDGSNYFGFGRFFELSGYNSQVGFPEDVPITLIAFEPEDTGWTVSTSQPDVTQIRNGNEWWTLQSQGKMADGSAYPAQWVSKGEGWFAPSVFGHFMILMIGLPFFFLSLAWYIGQIFGDGEGRSLAWDFPFSKSFWVGNAGSGEANSAPAAEGDAYKPREKSQLSIAGDPQADILRETRERSEKNRSLICHNLSKSYHSQTALREVSLEMDSDRIFVLLGQNGAGKSTLISLLAGLHPASAGDAYFRGLSIGSELSMIQERAGICPQDHIFFEALTGRQHVRFWLDFRGLGGGGRADCGGGSRGSRPGPTGTTRRRSV